MDVRLEQLGVPEQRKVVQDGVIRRERHIVWQPRTRQRDIGEMHQVVVGVDHAVAHVRGLLAVGEEQQLAGGVVDLRVRRHAPFDREAPVEVLFAGGFGGQRVDAVQIPTLVETGQRGAAVHDDIGARGVLHQRARAPAVVALGDLHGLGQAGPQRTAGLVLSRQSIGADEPVAVERFSVPETDDVNHAVAVERVVELQRRM